MTFKDLARIIRQQQYGGSSIPVSESDPEVEDAKMLLNQLHTNYLIASRERKDKWFAQHPEEKYLNESYEDFVKECKVDEWLWYFIQRIMSRTPQQRFQDERFPDYGYNHKSVVHGIDEPCKEDCRFWPETGRIDDIEVLKEYREYQDYNKVREIWDSLVQPH